MKKGQHFFFFFVDKNHVSRYIQATKCQEGHQPHYKFTDINGQTMTKRGAEVSARDIMFAQICIYRYF